MPLIVIPYYAVEIFHFPGTIAVNDVFPLTIPYDGEIIGYYGSSSDRGTGAGTSTDFQVENDDVAGKNYFSVQPTIEVDSATNLLEGGQLDDSPTFLAGQTLRARATAISTAPKNAQLHLVMKYYRTLTVS